MMWRLAIEILIYIAGGSLIAGIGITLIISFRITPEENVRTIRTRTTERKRP